MGYHRFQRAYLDSTISRFGLGLILLAWLSRSFGLPLDAQTFEKFAKTRDQALGTVIYDGAELVVFSTTIDPKAGLCELSSIASPINIAEYEAKLKKYREQAEARNNAIQANKATIRESQAKFKAEYRELVAKKTAELRQKLQSVPPGGQAAQERMRITAEHDAELQRLSQELLKRAHENDNIPPAPEVPKQETVQLRTASVVLLYKNKPIRAPIVQTEEPWDEHAAAEKRKPKSQLLTEARQTYLPIIEKACTGVEQVSVTLGFYEWIETAQQNFSPNVARPRTDATMVIVKRNGGWNADYVELFSYGNLTLGSAIVKWGSSTERVWLANSNHFYVNGYFVREKDQPQASYAGVVNKPADYWNRFEFYQEFGIPVAIFEGYFRAAPPDAVFYVYFVNFFSEFSKQCKALLGSDAQDLQAISVRIEDTGFGGSHVDVTPGEIVRVQNKYVDTYKLAYHNMQALSSREMLGLSRTNSIKSTGIWGYAMSLQEIDRKSRQHLRGFIQMEHCDSPVVAQIAENFSRRVNHKPSLQEEAGVVFDRL